jgi:hypothetical protein
MGRVPDQVLRGFVHTLKPWRNLSFEELSQFLNGSSEPQLPPAPVLTIPLAAKRAQCHPGTIRNWIRRGQLKRIPLGKRICRVSVAELDKLLAGGVK